MKCAKIQTIPSVTGMAKSACANGSRNASVPKTQTRMSSAIGMAMKSSATLRSLSWIGCRSCSIADWPVT